MGDRGQAAISLMSDVDGIDSGYLLGSIVSNLLRKCSSDVWRAALFFHHRWYGSTGLHSEWLLKASCYTVVQSLNCVQLFAAPWTTACQAPLSSNISWSLLKFVSTELVMLYNHLILCVSKTKSAWPSKENSLISCVMNLFGSSVISSSCPSLSFLWASNSIRSLLVSFSCGTQQEVQCSCPLADLALASHWGSLSCWRPLWIPHPPSQIPQNCEQTAGKSSGSFHGDGPTSYSAKILVRSLGQEDPLEESMAAPPVFLRGESHGQRAWWGIVHRVMNHHIWLKWLSTAQHRCYSPSKILSRLFLIHHSSLLAWQKVWCK